MLWPRSLFGRLALLLLAVLAIAIAVTVLLFRQDRAALLERQFGETKIAQLQAMRVALADIDERNRAAILHRLGQGYHVRIVPEAEGPVLGNPPAGPLYRDLQERLKDALGEGTALRLQPRQRLLWVRLEADNTGYWIGFPLPPRPVAADAPSRALIWSLITAAALVLAAFLFARYLARPLRELDAAVARVGRGESPEPLPETGPSEIARVNRGFNRMLANLQQLEHDRALLLAGVSHDLRTPLARLRLGLEMGMRDETLKRGMTDDIEEMDRIIGQFLDFARNDAGTAAQVEDLDAIVGETVDRYRRAGKDIAFAAGPVPGIPLRRTAVSRLVANLVDNALAYGAPPVAGEHADRGRCDRARGERSWPRHPARPGPAAEAAVHARIGRTRQRSRHRRRRSGTRHRGAHRAHARRRVHAGLARGRRDDCAGDVSGAARPQARARASGRPNRAVAPACNAPRQRGKTWNATA